MGIQAKLLILLLTFAAGSTSGAWLMHRVDLSAAKIEQDRMIADHKKQIKEKDDALLALEERKQQTVTRIEYIREKALPHLSDSGPCWGRPAVRVRNQLAEEINRFLAGGGDGALPSGANSERSPGE